MSAPSVRAVRPFRQPAVLVGRDPRDDEVLHLAGRVDGDDSAATGRGKRAGALDDLPQDDVEVEAPRCCAEWPQSVAEIRFRDLSIGLPSIGPATGSTLAITSAGFPLRHRVSTMITTQFALTAQNKGHNFHILYVRLGSPVMPRGRYGYTRWGRNGPEHTSRWCCFAVEPSNRPRTYPLAFDEIQISGLRRMGRAARPDSARPEAPGNHSPRLVVFSRKTITSAHSRGHRTIPTSHG